MIFEISINDGIEKFQNLFTYFSYKVIEMKNRKQMQSTKQNQRKI